VYSTRYVVFNNSILQQRQTRCNRKRVDSRQSLMGDWCLDWGCDCEYDFVGHHRSSPFIRSSSSPRYVRPCVHGQFVTMNEPRLIIMMLSHKNEGSGRNLSVKNHVGKKLLVFRLSVDSSSAIRGHNTISCLLREDPLQNAQRHTGRKSQAEGTTRAVGVPQKCCTRKGMDIFAPMLDAMGTEKIALPYPPCLSIYGDDDLFNPHRSIPRRFLVLLLLLMSSSWPRTVAKEIIPSDEWQWVGPNDTVPAGLEIRMDLGGNSGTWARIIHHDTKEERQGQFVPSRPKRCGPSCKERQRQRRAEGFHLRRGERREQNSLTSVLPVTAHGGWYLLTALVCSVAVTVLGTHFRQRKGRRRKSTTTAPRMHEL